MRRPLLAGVFGCCLMLILAGGAEAAAPAFRLQSAVGLVEVRAKGQREWKAARDVRKLSAGDQVRTGRNSSVYIVTADGARFAVGPNTSVELRSPSRWRVLLGRVLAFLTGTRGLEIGTEAAVAAAQGTTFQIEVSEDGTTVLTVAEGQVRFFNEQGSVTVLGSEQSTARVGQAPTRPIVVDPRSLMAWEAGTQTLLIGLAYPLVSSDPAQLEQELGRRQQEAERRPEDAAAHTALAEVLLDLHRTDEGLAQAERAVELAPDQAASRGVLGYALLQAGRPAEAQQEFEAAAGAAPADARWQIGLGLVAIGQRDPGPAVEILHRAAQLAPQEALPEAYLAVAYLRRGDLEAAATAASQAVALNPDSATANVSLAYVRLAQGQPSDAVAAADKAVREAPQSALAHEALGTALTFAGQPAAAGAELDRALELDPLSASAHLARAKLLATQGALEAALQEGQQAVALDPQSAPARSTLGLLFLLSNDPVRAGRQFQEALALEPSLAEAHTGWGQVLLRRGRFREAVEQQKLAVALDTGSAAAENNLGGVYAALGQFDQARQHLLRAIELQPGWGMPYANLAAVYLEENRIREALDAGERAVVLGEQSAFAHTVLARIYARQGRIDRAFSELRQAVALDDRYPQAHFQLAQLYLDQGRSQDAVREVLTTVTTDPSAMLEMRDYARTETTLAGGSEDRFHLDARHSAPAEEGRLSYFASGLLDDTEGFRPINQDESERFLEAIAGYQSRPTQQLAFFGTLFDRDGGLPGPARGDFLGDPDDRQDFAGYDAFGAYRQRLSRRVTSTLKYSLRHSDLDFRNPDSLTGQDTDPFQSLKEESSQYSPELRVDADLGRFSSLSLGYARSHDRVRAHGMAWLFDPDTGETVLSPFSIRAAPITDTVWLEAGARASERFSLTAGGYWGRESGSRHVALPKLVALYRPDRATWWSLTAIPIFRSDALELAPVEALADPKGLSSNSFAGGGYARSYELRWQRQGGRASTLTSSLTYQQAHDLLLDVEDPALTGLPGRLLLDEGHRWVADAAYEQWLTGLIAGRAWVRWQSSRGDFVTLGATDREWPGVPDWLAGARLDYISATGLSVALETVAVGRRFADVENRETVAGHLLLNLQTELRRGLRWSYFVEATNLTNRSFETFAGFPEPGRTFLAGFRYRY